MSVAFRRDSDEEHLEPKFEIPIPPGPNLVTRRGLAQIRARCAAVEALLPTLTEDAAIAEAKRDLRYWTTRQSTAQLVPDATGAKVELGCRVRFTLKGKERTVQIVGDDEAEPAQGLLSFSAPLSRALLGAEPGEIMPFAGDEEAIEIIAIDVPDDAV